MYVAMVPDLVPLFSLKAKVTHLVMPLVTMVAELSRRQQELFKLLSKKDREIQELKENRGTVRRSEGL